MPLRPPFRQCTAPPLPDREQCPPRHQFHRTASPQLPPPVPGHGCLRRYIFSYKYIRKPASRRLLFRLLPAAAAAAAAAAGCAVAGVVGLLAARHGLHARTCIASTVPYGYICAAGSPAASPCGHHANCPERSLRPRAVFLRIDMECVPWYRYSLIPSRSSSCVAVLVLAVWLRVCYQAARLAARCYDRTCTT